MTDERQRSQDELRAFLALFDPWKTVVVGATLSAATLGVAVALVMLFRAYY